MSNNEAYQHTVAATDIYNIDTETWSVLQKFITPHHGFQAAIVENYIYLSVQEQKNQL